MKRVSGLLCLALLVLGAGPFSSLAQNDNPLTGQLAVIQPEWGKSANVSRPSAQYALHRPGAEFAEFGGAPPSCVFEGARDSFGLPMQTSVALPLPIPQDSVIEFCQDVLMGLLMDGRASQPGRLHRPMFILIVLISDSGADTTAGNVRSCWQEISHNSISRAALALKNISSEFRFPTKRGPTKWGGYTNRNSQDLSRHYEWLSPAL